MGYIGVVGPRTPAGFLRRKKYVNKHIKSITLVYFAHLGF